MREGRTDLLHNVSAGNHPLVHHDVLKEPPAEQKIEEKEAQIHFYISLEMLGYSRGIIPPHNRIKPLLFPLILQRLRYYLIGCCTV